MEEKEKKKNAKSKMGYAQGGVPSSSAYNIPDKVRAVPSSSAYSSGKKKKGKEEDK
jgi:hypothetical protein